MRETYASLFVHLVWATWDRSPLITPDREEDIHRWIINECRKCKSWVTAIGSVEDHIHVLVDIAPPISVSELVKQMKGSSSYLVNAKFRDPVFKWQGAYGAFSVGHADVESVAQYISHQKRHHDSGTTKPELEWPDLTHPIGREVCAGRSAPAKAG